MRPPCPPLCNCPVGTHERRYVRPIPEREARTANGFRDPAPPPPEPQMVADGYRKWPRD